MGVCGMLCATRCCTEAAKKFRGSDDLGGFGFLVLAPLAWKAAIWLLLLFWKKCGTLHVVGRLGTSDAG